MPRYYFVPGVLHFIVALTQINETFKQASKDHLLQVFTIIESYGAGKEVGTRHQKPVCQGLVKSVSEDPPKGAVFVRPCSCPSISFMQDETTYHFVL